MNIAKIIIATVAGMGIMAVFSSCGSTSTYTPAPTSPAPAPANTGSTAGGGYYAPAK